MALGHAHTLVLGTDRDRCEHVYVFGSNHYGQLGVGQPMEGSQTNGGEPHILKSLVPMVLSIAKPIRLIHTKFFTNVSGSFSNRCVVAIYYILQLIALSLSQCPSL